MQLWMATLLLILFVVVIIITLSLAKFRGKELWMILTVVLSIISILAISVYIMLTFIFINAVKNEPPIEQFETTLATTSKPVITSKMTVPKPVDYDLPTEDVPKLHPDTLGLRNTLYEEMPTFTTQNEVTNYVLYQFLNNIFEFEFYITKDIAVDEGTGYCILTSACETAMTYYLFSSYSENDLFTKECDESKVYAKIKLTYTNPEYDLEARAEALEFVMKNPMPIGGFKDFETEKSYALKIHDFIARKVSYSPIGYDPESMFYLKKYEALQEAYNVLAEEENMAVCAAYARAFALVAQYAGINTVWAYGNVTERESHAWNIIYPCDGSKAVNVDVTWDDTGNQDYYEQEYISDRYFYIPVSEDYEHTLEEGFEEFLNYINMK